MFFFCSISVCEWHAWRLLGNVQNVFHNLFYWKCTMTDCVLYYMHSNDSYAIIYTSIPYIMYTVWLRIRMKGYNLSFGISEMNCLGTRIGVDGSVCTPEKCRNYEFPATNWMALKVEYIHYYYSYMKNCVWKWHGYECACLAHNRAWMKAFGKMIVAVVCQTTHMCRHYNAISNMSGTDTLCRHVKSSNAT